VGLFAALSLSERGLSVQIIDKEWRGSTHSYALALHPQTLRLLDEYGAANDLLQEGHRVERIALYGERERIATLDFSALGGAFPFVLVTPQSALERALEAKLKERKIKVFWNHQALGLEQDGKGVTARVGRMEKYSAGYPVAHTEWAIAKEFEVRSRFLVGADGCHSFARRSVEGEFEEHGAVETFVVFEFPAHMDSLHEARMVFHDGTTNVVWPLGDERGRWSFQVDRDSSKPPELVNLRELISARAPWFQPQIEKIHWSTTVLFEKRLVDRFGRRRIWLAGDAAHMTGPVGAQSMNIGLREAHDLAERFSAIHKGGGSLELLESYQNERKTEWEKLLGIEASLKTTSDAPDWIGKHPARILPCIPASGEDLQQLLKQIGLRLA
jgi:2-polyprenyl-6-methoxyphenol hydroxylase-like FAD-dependent oxidoreductase